METLKSKIAFSVFMLLLIVAMACKKDPTGTEDPIEDNPNTVNLNITNMVIGNAITSGKYRMITFDIKWGNNWETSCSPDNWDAAWVFLKYKAGSGDWKHATLSTVTHDHQSPSGVVINATSDGKGVYIRRGKNGTGVFSASNVSLKWNYGLDDVTDAANIEVKVLGLEMTYIPQGSFYTGDNGYSMASFTKGKIDKRSWFITNENAIEVTNNESNGYYYTSSKDFWNVSFNSNEDTTGTSFIIPADFPKGYRAIYCMKYEMTQQQYVDFLNTLSSIQQANRYDRDNYNRFGYTISENNGIYSTSHPNRACGFLSPEDGFAFADWAGLRPMTELEFEKICRGINNQPVSGEYVWGTTYIKNAVSVNGTEDDREYITTNGVNCYYPDEQFNPQFALNSGIFAGQDKSREKSGATYYGVMEMSGNLDEICVSVGIRYGRVFTYENGDGILAESGSPNEINWPLSDGKGVGYRGGNLAQDQHCLQVSDRTEATLEINRSHRHIPWGFRGVRTVLE